MKQRIKGLLFILTVSFALSGCPDSSTSNNNTNTNPNPSPSETCPECYSSSGACSSHDGVDCSAGADSDGSVICNDGWRGSSVDYNCN